MGYKLITPPTEYPVVLADLVSVHIKVDDTSYEASLLAEYIASATELVEDFTQRQFMQATWECQLRDWSEVGNGDYFLKLRKAPLVSVTSVKYDDSNDTEQTLSPSNYVVDTTSVPGGIFFNGSRPAVYNKPNAIRIRFVAGYGTDADNTAALQRTAITSYRGSRAKTAILKAVADLYEHRQDEVMASGNTKTLKLTNSIERWLYPLKLFL